ncbi:MAG: metal ABC transporter permease [Pseudomonadota bacterium]
MSIDLSIILPAFAAGLCVLLSHIPLGKEVLNRGIIFIDLAIAQFAGLGVILAYTLGIHADDHWQIQLFAFSSALVGSLILNLAEHYFKRHGAHHQEAFIGICFVLAATASILLLNSNAHGGEQLKELLVGQILWTEWSQLIVPAFVGLLVFGLAWRTPSVFKGFWFYILFSLAITLSVQLVGVYLVFSSLIIPALFANLINVKGNHTQTIVALLLGCVAYLLGLLLSSVLDLPTGAVIVWSMACLSAVVLAVFHALKGARIG